MPLIVKDNFNTADMPRTAGSLSLKGSVPPVDAFQVRKLREAGAVILAKSNMPEFAWSPFETVSSILPGYTRNPYALDPRPRRIERRDRGQRLASEGLERNVLDWTVYWCNKADRTASLRTISAPPA